MCLCFFSNRDGGFVAIWVVAGVVFFLVLAAIIGISIWRCSRVAHFRGNTGYGYGYGGVPMGYVDVPPPVQYGYGYAPQAYAAPPQPYAAPPQPYAPPPQPNAPVT